MVMGVNSAGIGDTFVKCAYATQVGGAVLMHSIYITVNLEKEESTSSRNNRRSWNVGVDPTRRTWWASWLKTSRNTSKNSKKSATFQKLPSIYTVSSFGGEWSVMAIRFDLTTNLV